MTYEIPITRTACSIVPTFRTSSCSRFTIICMTVAITLLTIRKIPVSRLTLVTLPSISIRATTTLSGLGVTKIVQGADGIAFASCKYFHCSVKVYKNYRMADGFVLKTHDCIPPVQIQRFQVRSDHMFAQLHLIYSYIDLQGNHKWH